MCETWFKREKILKKKNTKIKFNLIFWLLLLFQVLVVENKISRPHHDMKTYQQQKEVNLMHYELLHGGADFRHGGCWRSCSDGLSFMIVGVVVNMNKMIEFIVGVVVNMNKHCRRLIIYTQLIYVSRTYRSPIQLSFITLSLSRNQITS
jgi:hypothetical protein